MIFASGAGTNTQRILDHFRGSGLAKVALIVSNNPEAGVLRIASREGVPSRVIGRPQFRQPEYLVQGLLELPADLIVLAGFLWKLPLMLVNAFPKKIVNIHPALLPKHGGQGMYGPHVHQAVIEAKEPQSGITIHYVNEHYDEGAPIFQKNIPVDPSDTAATLAEKVHLLEYEYYPRVIEDLLTN